MKNSIQENPKVLHLIDALNAGGSERMAVNIVNELEKRNYSVSLCTTRRGGPLVGFISPNVDYFCLNRKSILDICAFYRLTTYISSNKIQLIHAHSSSLFIASLVKIFIPHIKVVWHNHYGLLANQSKLNILYRTFTHHLDGIIAVNQTLVEWAVNKLNSPPAKVWYLPNFPSSQIGHPIDDLPGEPGFRLACVAHLRLEKDHLTLIRAMEIVVYREPRAHLLLIGKDYFPEVAKCIWDEINNLKISENITWLGPRDDVLNILASSDIGILSSTSEGLPLSILEYGNAGLAVIATNVGECPAILDYGNAGCLVRPQSPEELASAILLFLQKSELRQHFGKNLQERVKHKYSVESALLILERIYKIILHGSEE